MTNTVLIQKATEEIKAKTFGTTEQFLEIHEIVYEDNNPKVARVDRDKKDGTAIVYFPVKDEKFYLAVYLNTEPEVSIRGVGTESYNSVYFHASSEILTLEQLSQMTTLKSSLGRNKGDEKRSKNGRTRIVWKNSTIFFEPNPEPDEFEDKLKKLLDYLDQDKEGVARLVDEARGSIQVAIEFHNGNTMLGGPHINKEVINRMAGLNLEIDFDLYVGGKFFKS
ncbi:MAG: DUF4279 domain-containing protein [Bacteroidota bacterium]|nr:DUF4279 domain-containing protein [Bacteroidota bacterium]